MLFNRSRPGRPSAGRPHRVGPVQAAVLATIRDHADHAHGIGIARHLRRTFDPDIADAQTYVALRRLEARGLVAERPADEGADGHDLKNKPSSGRRGRPHKLYSLTVSGKRALENAGAENSASQPGAKAEQVKGAAHDQDTSTLTPVVG